MLTALEEHGHDIHVSPHFPHGKPSMIRIHDDGMLEAAITSREKIGYVAGW